ncbi:hypothetical protein ACS0TY_004917 [Phlomoides rotata]
MVAKQYWRHLHQGESLAARILKARYYPRGNIDSATMGYHPSFLWRNILKARDLVMESMACRVWNDSSIKAFDDKWIGTNETQKPGRKHPKGEPNHIVDFFIEKISMS